MVPVSFCKLQISIPFISENNDVLTLLKCLLGLEKRPFLLEEEDTYEPPEDPDSGISYFPYFHGSIIMPSCITRATNIDKIPYFSQLYH